MKIIFFGTPKFAAYNLLHLLKNNQKIVSVVTPPDSKTGRGKKIKFCAVKEIALAKNIPILQPENLKEDEFILQLKKLKADIFIIVAFRKLPELVWKIPPKGTINLHASLLPKYRGAAPINRVLINGESETGVTTFFINNNIDTGEIIQQTKTKVNNATTAGQLHEILKDLGNDILIDTIKSIRKNIVNTTIQKTEKNIIYAPKLNKDLLKINWKRSATKIHNIVRGLSPYINEKAILKDISICPSAWFFIEDENGNKKRVKLHRTKVIKARKKNMQNFMTDNKTYLHINTDEDIISVLNLQIEGKNSMKINDFLQGRKITKDHKIT